MATTHHILVFGCTEPGQASGSYNCGGMSSEQSDNADSKDPLAEQKPTCTSGEQVVYAWAMGAPAFTFPSDVSYKVGKGTPIKTLVMQMHYKDPGLLSFTLL